MREAGDGVEKRVNVVTQAEQHSNSHGKAGCAVDEHTDEDGLGHHNRRVVRFLGHVEGGVGADKGKDVANHADHEGQALRRPVTRVQEAGEDGVRISMGRQDDERDENSEEAQDVQDQNQTLELGQRRGHDGVDEDGEQYDGPVEQGAVPRLRRVVIVCGRHGDHALEHVACQEAA